METMGRWKTLMILLSSLFMLVLEKTLLEIISPLTSQWEWTWINNQTVTETSPAADDNEQHGTLDWKLCLVFIICPIVELVLSPFLGVVSRATGIDFIAFIGIVLAIVICIIYALNDSFLGILAARALHGLDIVCLNPTAMVRIENIFPPDTKEGKSAIALAMSAGAISFAVISVCGTAYEYLHKSVFLLLIPIELITAWAIMMTCEFTFDYKKSNFVDKNEEEWKLLYEEEKMKLIRSNNEDKYKDKHNDENENDLNRKCSIHNNNSNKLSPDVSLSDVAKNFEVLLSTGLLTISWLFLPTLDPIIASWMQDSFASGTAEVGLLWASASVSIVTANIISATFTMVKPELTWLFCLCKLLSCCIPVILLPFTPNYLCTCATFAFYIYFASCVRFGAVFIISDIAETQYKGAYNYVWAIANYGFALPFLIGTAVGVPLYNSIGFTYLCLSIGILMFLYSPLIVYLRRSTAVGNEIPDPEEISLMKLIPIKDNDLR